MFSRGKRELFLSIFLIVSQGAIEKLENPLNGQKSQMYLGFFCVASSPTSTNDCRSYTVALGLKIISGQRCDLGQGHATPRQSNRGARRPEYAMRPRRTEIKRHGILKHYTGAGKACGISKHSVVQERADRAYLSVGGRRSQRSRVTSTTLHSAVIRDRGS